MSHEARHHPIHSTVFKYHPGFAVVEHHQVHHLLLKKKHKHRGICNITKTQICVLTFLESIQYLVVVSQTTAPAPSSKLECIEEISQVRGSTTILKAQSEQSTLHQLQ